ncbi:PAS domain-containing sensor histidine kinase [Aquabacterium sp.]|uniref:PAS domain-containing sensor histidine kinase n=1 Tax=Aquabacterium sp. TaxID=1872578 RepID=UPI0035C77005
MVPPVFQTFFEASVDALFVTGPDGRIAAWSHGAQLTYGHLTDEALGRPMTDLLVPPAALTEARAAFERVRSGNLPSHEALRVRKDGIRIYVNATLQAMHAADGTLQGHLHRDTDITHLKVSQDATHLGHHYGRLLDSTPDAIVIVNDIGRIVLANAHAEALFGWTEADLIGLPIEVLMPQRFHARHVHHRTGYFEHSRTRPMGAGLDLFGRRRDGTEFPVEISLSPLDTDKGRFGMSAIRDISERKRFEQALHDKNVELQRASQAKDRFLASMSHELRTPLNAIIGFTSLLLMRLPGPLTTDQEKQLEAVRTSGKHLLALINDLLDVARIESGHVAVHIEQVDGHSVVAEVMTALQLAAQAKGLALMADLPSSPLTLHTDRRALHQILLNLGNNAVKYTPTGSVRISAQQHAEGRLVRTRFTVTDTGPGIAAAEQHKLFKAFSQIERSDKALIEGTGLGLYLCQQLAQLIGGRIDMHSVEGEGSTFGLVIEEEVAP